MTQSLRNKKGVTLVELLAVIVILGIIAAIAVPTIGGLIDRQRENAAKATYTSIEEQARLYAVDDADGVFTLADLVTDGFGLKDNVLTTGATGATAVTNESVTITVTGSTVALSYTTAGDLYINGYIVTAMTLTP
ncbi:MAG: prepilin-type N-terminal cleavage/methylation domain-containing protein [Acholeplasmataceae bacterium]|nr:prepilin-type N-terminal cleavage/methylation domain-containing protein [Acholeplasmataceae bacterium]